MILFPWLYSPFWADQPAAGLTYICPQIEVKYDLSHLGVACGQYVEFPSRC